MPNNQHYLERVTPQHKKRKFLKWLDANIQPFYDAELLLKSMDDKFHLFDSVGVQLDVTGDIVGRERVLSFDPADGSSPILDDETYRLLQKAKISMNQWDGTIPGVLELWDNLFPQHRLIIQDNQDMTMDLYVMGLFTPLETELLVKGYIAPKPMGVFIRLTFVYESEPFELYLSAGGHRHGSVMRTTLPLQQRELTFNIAGHIGGAAWSVSRTTIRGGE